MFFLFLKSPLQLTLSVQQLIIIKALLDIFTIDVIIDIANVVLDDSRSVKNFNEIQKAFI